MKAACYNCVRVVDCEVAFSHESNMRIRTLTCMECGCEIEKTVETKNSVLEHLLDVSTNLKTSHIMYYEYTLTRDIDDGL